MNTSSRSRRPASAADVHQLEISIDGERKAITNVSRRPGVPAGDDAPPNQGAFRFAVPAGPRSVGVAFVERSEALSEAPLRPPGRNRGALPSVVSVTITGPFNATGPGDTPSRRRLFVCRPASADQESACADRILTTLLRRAYRRNVTADDLRRVRRFYEAGRAERDFDLGIQRALERVLVSPQFLFRIEQEPAGAAPGSVYRVGDFELASRLSFFLWSSIPDDELLDAAAAGTLRQPDVLRRQVNRMLADPRSRSLVTNFAAQWLFLRDVETKEPDVYLFRDFDEGVRAAFVRETELFLDSILRENRSVLDLLTADYTFLNEPLAKHYGIPNITGSHFRRVTLPKGSPRRGLLGQGSILSITSYSTRTSAVLRGKYVLENLLASPPPPPPPNVPSLNTERSGQPLSMKEAMQLHRASPACASCHAKMDPIGFALENFDALGRWRAEENGRPIEVSSALPDGTTVDGVEGVRQLVLRDPALFVEAMTGKLLMYALTRNIQYYDQPTIRVIARESARQNYTFASLVLGVVSSVPFQSRMAPQVRSRGAPIATGRDSMTFLTRKALTRRTMLKGMGASVALPLLDSMMPALSAAVAKQAPMRLGFVYAAHGVIHSEWKPRQTGRQYELSPNLQPLEGVRDHFNIFTNLSHLRSRQQGRRQRRSQPRRRGLAHRRACLRPHASGRRDPPRHVGRSDRGQAPGQGQPGALDRDDARPGDAGGVRFRRLLLRQHRLVAQRDLAQHARDPPARRSSSASSATAAAPSSGAPASGRRAACSIRCSRKHGR